MSYQPTRRTLLRTFSAMGLAAPVMWPSLVRAVSPNGKLNHASIGVGGMQGPADLGNFLKHPRLNLAALCDVDSGHLAAAAPDHKDAKRVRDWRELIQTAGDTIDSVSVTVPDHMHAAIAATALRAGKHVYGQKPMCHEVAEVRALVGIAKASGRVTQLGTQGAATVGNRLMIDFLKRGVVGKIKKIVIWSNRRGAVDRYRLEGPRPEMSTTPPETLDWDLWLGTAQARPFAPEVYHPIMWRSWQHFGTGWLGDMGCHIFHSPWAGLGLTAPKRVRADVQESWLNSPARRAETWPQVQKISWVFPGNALTAESELLVEWYDGDHFPPDEIQKLNESPNFPPQGSMAIGTDGAIVLPHMGSAQLSPREKFAQFEYPKLPARNHYHHFVDACLGGEPTESSFVATGGMNEAILLGGTVATRLPGEWLDWDAAAMKITNKPEANKLLSRTYRAGWSVEGLS